MFRRNFLISGAGAVAALAQKKPNDTVIATATQDATPRVGIVLSSFKEGEEHDGTKISGLADPQPPTADLTDVQMDAWVRKAIDMASLRSQEFYEVVEAEDWVVIKTHPRADPRIAGTVISYLAGQKRGLRFTLTDRLAQPGVWPESYRKLVSTLGPKFPEIRLELVDLNSAPTIDLPVPGRAAVSYPIPKMIQQCDRLVSIAPLSTHPATGVSLTIGNYAAMISQPVTADEALVDLFSYRPADLALAGGCLAVDGDGATLHHNVLISGMKAVAVDSVAASVMGFKPAELPFLALAEKRGFGAWDIDDIWTRGNDLEQALHEFKKPAGWRPAAAPAAKK